MLVTGDGTEDVIGGDRDTVEADTAGAGESLAEAVVLGVGHHTGAVRVDTHDQRIAGIRAHRAEHQPVRDKDARGKGLAPVEEVPAVGRCESEIGTCRRLRVRNVGAPAPEPLLRGRPELEPVGFFRGAEEPCAPRQHVVPGQQFTDGAVGRRDLPDDRAGGAPVDAAPRRAGRCQQRGQPRFAQP